MVVRIALVLAMAVLALAGVGTAAAYAPAASGTTVRVTAKDFSFGLSTKSVRAGRVTFVIKDTGHEPHDFAIAGRTSKIISPGQTTRVTVTLKPGRYPYRCTVDSHAELGMKGVLRVHG